MSGARKSIWRAHRQFRIGTKRATATGMTTDYALHPFGIELEIDVATLIDQLGERASKSKRGTAAAMHGALRVKVKPL